jgi:Leucine-rich repeat (LRR) protein
MVIAQLTNLNNLYLSHNKITSRCVWAYFEMPALKVLDVRFNEVSPEERDAIKGQAKEQLQLFL